ncbi:MAG: hypothetical protein ACLUGJ_02550 [Blautia wexlerae]
MIKIRLMGEREEIKDHNLKTLVILMMLEFCPCQISMPIEEGQVIMEESIWKWRKKMLCNVIWKGKGIGMKGKMLKEVQFVDDEHEKIFLG